MDRNDSQAIEQLFSKLDAVERQAPPRDGEAEAYIRDRIASQPGAPYYMAQTIIVQEQALEAARARIEELEAQAQQHSGGILGGLFGNSRPPQRTVPRIGRAGTAAPRSPLPAGVTNNARAGAGGGFLAGAAQTAMGVAGGVLLGNAIAGMFGGGEAHAADDDAGAADEGFDGGFDDIGF
ncbi:DUF2076 domain-containing protein [Aquamicrobium defluvii]|uniref:ABC transporter substrate-binding protein n=1 Tax=Aquamicrobium defluvii TaxID=69279 RepID=A0A011UT52_9HYPH|nr:DUF2076 domain-containing protein [Aquamicrobium defluvii]EXL09038.1 hypothetical protein BG36_23910 [Aquamicrobium defluvii]EZQ15338.1 hypothetical protein CF98_11555 [Halopseudomonas bauzanensis]TDR34596.1 hypothetical protein DES43_11325 [Aquamicrobium defluvii]